MSKHYRYGGSTAKRTINCPGWRALADLMPPQGSSSFADVGTVCHEACEIYHIDPNEAITYEDLLQKDIKCGDEVLTMDLLEDKVIPAYEAMIDIMDEFGVTDMDAEVITEYEDDIGGTVDLMGISDDGKRVVVLDYKFGDGHMVDAEENEQFLFYAWINIDGILKQHPNIETVTMGVIQPSHNRPETVDLWDTTLERIYDFETEFLDAVEIADASDGTNNLCAGDHCTFCPGAAVCPEKTGQAFAALRIDLEGEDLLEKVPEALKLCAELEPWIKAVRGFAHEQLELGVDVPGYKLVAKRATRKWLDIDAAEKYLKRKLKAQFAMKSEVISPAQAEKVAKKLKIDIDIEKKVHKVSSGNTLAKEDDKREAVLSSAALQSSLQSIA